MRRRVAVGAPTGGDFKCGMRYVENGLKENPLDRESCLGLTSSNEKKEMKV